MILGIVGISLSFKKNRNQLLYPAGWLVMLFFVNENGPFGLYHLQLPLWSTLVPERFAHAMALPLCFFGGYLLNEMLEPLIRDISRRRLKKRMLHLLSLLPIAILLFSEISINYDQIMDARSYTNPVTENDIEAFEWIKQNTPLDSTFFVNSADAGQWIPVFTGRKVFPFEKIINNPEIRNELLTTWMVGNPGSPEAQQELNRYGIDYIYFGDNHIYGRRPPYDYIAFHADPKDYLLIYRGKPSSNVLIFKVIKSEIGWEDGWTGLLSDWRTTPWGEFTSRYASPEEGAHKGTVGVFSAKRSINQIDPDFKWCRLINPGVINTNQFSHFSIRFRVISSNGTVGGFFFRPSGYLRTGEYSFSDLKLNPYAGVNWTILSFDLRNMGFEEITPIRFYMHFPNADNSSMIVQIDWVIFYSIEI
jgi:hypothetical protein